jgi:heme oxygenase (biliverdin-IX-beta and delta-forming)
LNHRENTASPDAVAVLRAETAYLHAQLDQNLPLGGPDATLADYAFHLEALRDWQMAITPWLARALLHTEPLVLIEQDLADCPERPEGSATAAAIDMQALHDADDGSDAFCWGMVYVLEGSRLGGKVLYRRLQEKLAPHPLRYLHYSEVGGASWPDTLAFLRSHLGDAVKRASAVKGAITAFTLLGKRFARSSGIS